MSTSFHDGFFDGLVLAEHGTVRLFLRTSDDRRYVLVAGGLEKLRVTSFMEGNIILDLEVVEAKQMTVEDVAGLYQLSSVDPGGQANLLLEAAKRRALTMISISPSYGAECLLLCEKWEMRPVVTSEAEVVYVAEDHD